ncbi:hypothetical protein LNL84_11950 [Vibrio sp. ZSDZ34]|uniref:ATPase n=1 Tax=Vibrio gelatinilyticus TaxID=2893468 RepID=A0A9X2AWQ1_9VIBR|nr:hypothetical protein [Vibrio gelatinilyticus]MCJ2377546.1 hypothetical protein [Vibrio gelatinilyticus]
MRNIRNGAILILALGLVGCASAPSKTDLQSNLSAEALAEFRSQQYQELAKVHAQWSTSLEGVEFLKIYAPENYREMMSAWKNAHQLFIEVRKDPSQVDSKHSVFSSDTYSIAFMDRINTVEYHFNAIQRLKVRADKILGPAIEEMDYLNSLNARQYYRYAYDSAYKDYERLFEYLVVGEDEQAASSQETFLSKAKALEVRVVLATYAVPLQQEVDVLSKAKYHELAPLSFGRVEGEIAKLVRMIEKDPRSFALFKQQVDSANFELRRLNVVVAAVKKMIDIEKSKFEPIVLQSESQLHAISIAATGNDYRDQSLEQQSERIMADVESLRNADEAKRLTKENTLLKERIALLEQQTEQQAIIVSQTSSHSELMRAQMDRNEEQIQTLERLVSSLKKQAKSQ